MLLNRLPTASGGVYVLPPLAGLRLKAGDYDHTYEGDPAGARVPRPEHVERVLEACRHAIADFGRYRVIEAKSCFYTVTSDDRFVLRRFGPQGWLISACSGHGFKFAALMGEAAAEGIMGLKSEAQVSDFMASRLTEGAI
jgi:glycine/D-amino acid oxidase-like deaminating enzyme